MSSGPFSFLNRGYQSLRPAGLKPWLYCWATSFPALKDQGQDRCLRSQRKKQKEVHQSCRSYLVLLIVSNIWFQCFFPSYCETLVSCDFTLNHLKIKKKNFSWWQVVNFTLSFINNRGNNDIVVAYNSSLYVPPFYVIDHNWTYS